MFFMECSIFNFMRILPVTLETTKLSAQEIHFNIYKIIEILESLYSLLYRPHFLHLILAVRVGEDWDPASNCPYKTVGPSLLPQFLVSSTLLFLIPKSPSLFILHRDNSGVHCDV
jgi:hypothetical protein